MGENCYKNIGTYVEGVTKNLSIFFFLLWFKGIIDFWFNPDQKGFKQKLDRGLKFKIYLLQGELEDA